MAFIILRDVFVLTSLPVIGPDAACAIEADNLELIKFSTASTK